MKYPQTAALIRSARLRKELSQEKTAELVGCSRIHMNRLEKGQHRPDMEVLGARLADVLGIDADALGRADQPRGKVAA